VLARLMPWTGVMLMSAMVLMNVHGTDGRKPTPAEAAAQLGVTENDLDKEYGVVPVDPANNLYSVQVRADRLPPGTEAATPYRGPFSNPRIEPFGPVQSGPTSPEAPASPDTDKPKR
jgi:hypothetical protein